MHHFRWLTVVLAILAIAYAGWWVFGRTMEQEILAAQTRFIAAVEDRDWKKVQSLLTNDYMDEVGHDRNTIITDAERIFGSFITLTLQTELVELRAAQKQATLKMKIRIEGQGLGISQVVITQANAMEGPWLFHWHQKGRWPWDWKIVQIHHNALYLPRPE